MWSSVIYRKFVGQVGIFAVFFGRYVLLNVVFHVIGEVLLSVLILVCVFGEVLFVVFAGFDFGMCCC